MFAYSALFLVECPSFTAQVQGQNTATSTTQVAVLPVFIHQLSHGPPGCNCLPHGLVTPRRTGLGNPEALAVPNAICLRE